jgi:outer membrane cobalamin receptor
VRLSLHDRVFVDPGLRFDHWGLTGHKTVSPWVQAQAPLPADVRIRAGMGIYRQFASFEQVLSPSTAVPAQRLAPERARHLDVSLEREIAGIRIQATFYDRQERDIIRLAGAETRVAGGRVVLGSSTGRFVNTLRGYARGVELLLQRVDPNGLSGWASYSYGRHRYDDVTTGESFWADFDQRHALNLYAHYRLSNRTSFSGKFRTSSNFPLVGYAAVAPGESVRPEAAFFLTSERNTARLPTYARLDIRANRVFNWQRRRLTLFAELTNALDRINYRAAAFGLNVQTRQVFGPVDTLIPVVPSAGFIIEF